MVSALGEEVWEGTWSQESEQRRLSDGAGPACSPGMNVRRKCEGTGHLDRPGRPYLYLSFDLTLYRYSPFCRQRKLHHPTEPELQTSGRHRGE